MPIRPVVLCESSATGRRLELAPGLAGECWASVAGPGERPGAWFACSAEQVGLVRAGLTYQAWGDGGHFVLRRREEAVEAEFQGEGDERPFRCKMDLGEFDRALAQLAQARGGAFLG